ncbi:MAG: Txe/YoeB family addiction module toxin [Micropruina sp.]|nr:Txe/YoeB family addiction module toxin [Micropruina sp.]
MASAWLRLRRLIELLRTPFEGTGKPEPLKHQVGNVWSRSITQEHRLVYAVDDDQIVVLAARFHYGG